MRGRMPWMVLLGLGAGLLLVPAVRRRLGRSPARRPRVPEVVRGTVPPDASAHPVASAAPDTVPGRSTRAVSPPHHPAAPDEARFEPVVPDAPELRDASAEPAAVDPGAGRAEPVPPTVRKRR